MTGLAEEAISGLEKLLTVNTTERSDNFDKMDEFFLSKDDYGISEYSECKHILFRTIGSSGYKVWDVMCFVPSVLFLIFLIYSLPRSRQKLSGAPFFFVAIHVLLFTTSIVSIVRVILMWMAPSPNDDKLASNLEKLSWSFTHAAILCLELTSLIIFMFPNLPSNKASKRILAAISIFSVCFGCLVSIIELRSSPKEFHVIDAGDNLPTNLFGDGGGVFILVISLMFAIPYAGLISVRCLQPKAGSRRSSTFTYCIVMLGVQGTRVFSGILLASDVTFGMCATNLTFFLLVEFLPPLVFMCVLCPYMQNRQGHSLLSQGYHTTMDDWMEDDTVGFNYPVGIMKKDQIAADDDDYELYNAATIR